MPMRLTVLLLPPPARHRRRCAWALLPLLAALAHAQSRAQADLPETPSRAVKFAGFGSLGAVHASERSADFSANLVNPGRAGYSRRIAYDVDSRLAAQMDVVFSPSWSAVVQLVAERNLSQDYAPVVEWANVSYRANADLSVRLGRITVPMFLVGDYRKTSYALPWVRPPVEVYGALPVTNSDGVDVSYRWNVGSVNNVSQASFGHTAIRLGGGAHAWGRQVVGLSNTTSVGALTLRASILTAAVSLDAARPLFTALRGFGAAGAALADRYDVDAKRTGAASFGFNYDPAAWLLMGEIGRGNGRSYLGDKTVGYLSGGYRVADVTPYLTYAASRSNQPASSAGLALAGLPAPAAAAAGLLNAQLNALLRTVVVQHTVSAGVRWDFLPERSLKLQYDRVRPQGGTTGSLINVQPDFVSGRPVHVVSAMLDFVF